VWFRRKGLPDGWSDIVDERVAVWRVLDDGERARVEKAADWLLRRKHWEAAQGFALDDEIKVTIAAQAALLILELGVREYRGVSAIIVYPTAMRSRGTYEGPVWGTVIDSDEPVIGEAHDGRGPVILAWDEVEHAARNPGSGHNVVYHEFAHKLDMLDDFVDGTPPMTSRAELDAWIEACTDVFEDLQAGLDRPPLDPYGATNPAEFFAVATEAFFDVPRELEEHEPKLYAAMRTFFGQDPAARARPEPRPGSGGGADGPFEDAEGGLQRRLGDDGPAAP
jgi:Mlc titration factor MtfA (ptsG expression regulator)